MLGVLIGVGRVIAALVLIARGCGGRAGQVVVAVVAHDDDAALGLDAAHVGDGCGDRSGGTGSRGLGSRSALSASGAALAIASAIASAISSTLALATIAAASASVTSAIATASATAATAATATDLAGLGRGSGGGLGVGADLLVELLVGEQLRNAVADLCDFLPRGRELRVVVRGGVALGDGIAADAVIMIVGGLFDHDELARALAGQGLGEIDVRARRVVRVERHTIQGQRLAHPHVHPLAARTLDAAEHVALG
jgi:hypothetical protein